MRMCQEGERAMNSSWRFLVVEALLLLFAVWQNRKQYWTFAFSDIRYFQYISSYAQTSSY